MDIKEAIKWQKSFMMMHGNTKEAVMACKTAVNALEKQLEQTPDFEGDGYADGFQVYDTWICPGCGKCYEVGYEEYDYCPACGQKIKHMEVE